MRSREKSFPRSTHTLYSGSLPYSLLRPLLHYPSNVRERRSPRKRIVNHLLTGRSLNLIPPSSSPPLPRPITGGRGLALITTVLEAVKILHKLHTRRWSRQHRHLSLAPSRLIYVFVSRMFSAHALPELDRLYCSHSHSCVTSLPLLLTWLCRSRNFPPYVNLYFLLNTSTYYPLSVDWHIPEVRPDVGTLRTGSASLRCCSPLKVDLPFVTRYSFPLLQHTYTSEANEDRET